MQAADGAGDRRRRGRRLGRRQRGPDRQAGLRHRRRDRDVRTLWQDHTLYVLAEVTDPIVDVSGPTRGPRTRSRSTSTPGNAKNGSYRFDDTQIRINADNVVSFGTGDEAFQQARLGSATRRTDTGYIVEAAISLLEYGGLGTFHGLDFQVNDATDGARTAIRNWAEPTGTGYQTTARWGVQAGRGGAPSSTTTLTAAPSSQVFGSSSRVTLTATVTADVPVSGPVEFVAGGHRARHGDPAERHGDPAAAGTHACGQLRRGRPVRR